MFYRLVFFLFKIVFIYLSLFLIPSAFQGLVDAFSTFTQLQGVMQPVLIGFVAGVVIYFTVIRYWHAFTTFEHELTHAIMGLPFLSFPTRFVSRGSKGGYVVMKGGIGGPVASVMITLAPYFLPTFSLIASLCRPLVPVSIIQVYDGFIGFTLAYHTFSTMVELRENFTTKSFTYAGTSKKAKTDIGQVGIISSVFMIAAFALIAHAVVFYLLTGGYPALGNYFTKLGQSLWEGCLWGKEKVTMIIDKL